MVSSDEKALDKARSCLMEGMYLLNEVALHTKARLEELSKRQVVFDEALEGLKQLCVLHEQTKKEANEFKKRGCWFIGEESKSGSRFEAIHWLARGVEKVKPGFADENR
ncbi:unnamed protein product [Lactuca saligna]|uniref:Uncharacterized protein n=1 Tax=Lactuca saligna TaxID=75948 RepID=A0AA35ZUE9_LACSI|nr:unnamed protein product [Lactuca saligna]